MTFKGPFQPKLICDAMIQSAGATMFKRFKFRLQSSDPKQKAALDKSKQYKVCQDGFNFLRN